MRKTRLPSGEQIAVLGLGTKGMGEQLDNHDNEIEAIRVSLDLKMNVIETAAGYADGAAENLVGKALRGRRAEAFLIGKVVPEKATKQEIIDACERSLRRLQTDRIDLYLLHGRGRTPLAETVEAFDTLARAGKIRYWGVNNFDVPDMDELRQAGGAAVQLDEVPYNLARRDIEYELLPWCVRRGIPIVACSPLDQGRLLDHSELRRIAAAYVATPAQIALAWMVRRDHVIALPRAGSPGHVKQNCVALDIPLSNDDFAGLERAFPPPAEKRPLAPL